MSGVSKATLGRLPNYLEYLKSVEGDMKTVSATSVAKALGLGEVQVRKDLARSEERRVGKECRSRWSPYH